jgi:hypothetical protein
MFQQPAPEDIPSSASLPALTNLYAFPHVLQTIKPHLEFIVGTISGLSRVARGLQSYPEIEKVFEDERLSVLLPLKEDEPISAVQFLLYEMARWNELSEPFKSPHTKEELCALAHSTRLKIPEMEQFLFNASLAESLRMQRCIENTNLNSDDVSSSEDLGLRMRRLMTQMRSSQDNCDTISRLNSSVGDQLNAEFQTLALILERASMPDTQ